MCYRSMVCAEVSNREQSFLKKRIAFSMKSSGNTCRGTCKSVASLCGLPVRSCVSDCNKFVLSCHLLVQQTLRQSCWFGGSKAFLSSCVVLCFPCFLYLTLVFPSLIREMWNRLNSKQYIAVIITEIKFFPHRVHTMLPKPMYIGLGPC